MPIPPPRRMGVGTISFMEMIQKMMVFCESCSQWEVQSDYHWCLNNKLENYNNLRNKEKKGQKKKKIIEISDDEDPIERDIALVMDQTQKSYQESRRVLIKFGGDIVNAIIELSDN